MQWLYGFLGGALIGLASALLLLTHGRIAGISSIVGGLVHRTEPDRAWRYAFTGGLIGTGIVAAQVTPSAIGAPTRSMLVLAIAGVIVGYGTQLGRGCTSGHGVCGISRLSTRSLVAVGTFMTTGAITAIIAGRLS